MQKLYTLVSIALLFAGTVRANDYSLRFHSGTVTPAEDLQSAATPEPGEIVDGRFYRLLQFYSVPTTEQKSALEQTGVRLIGYMPVNAFLVSLPAGYNMQLLAQHNARCLYKVQPYQKMNVNLRDEIPAYARQVKGYVDLRVQAYADLQAEFVTTLASAAGNVLKYIPVNHVVVLRVPEADVEHMASLPWVWYVEAVSPPSIPDDTKGRSLLRSIDISTDQPMGRHYNGDGVAAALADDGIVGPHIDFTGRITNHTVINTATTTHGDMTGGILAGAGNLDPSIGGMAGGVTLHVFDITNYTQIVDAVANHNQYSTVVSSTSYSQGCNEYTSDSQFGDQTTHDNPELLFVFSAGNNGTGQTQGDCGYGAGLPWATITGGYKQGKNVITVANIDNLEVLDNTSSRGPASDGRIKPEVSSNGKDQISTQPNNTYQAASDAVYNGTSGACPGISGISCQLIQAYKVLNSATDAPTALVKACLMNSAEDIGNTGPDYTYGFGRVNALRAVQVLENNRWLHDSVAQGATNNHIINVPAGVAKLKVMVYWADPGGNPAASTALVNDLDMTVTDPSVVAWSPWVLDPSPTASALSASATRGADHLNNQEQVTLDNPAAGAYTVAINGYAVPSGTQDYYLVYEFVYDDITVTYPIGGEGFAPGTTELIRWDALRSGGTFSIDYSADSGATWNPVTSGLAANVQQYAWTVPNVVSDQAMIRITRGAVAGVNAAPFSIVGVPANIVYNWCCPDSIRLTWTAIAGATGYEISMLGNKYMDSVGTADTNSFVMHGVIPTATYWFSVRALLANGKGQRALAHVKNPGLFNCTLAIDAGLTSLTSPAAGTLQDCQNLSSQLVKITLTNGGTGVLTGIPLKFDVDGGTIVSETYTGSLNPGQSDVYTFTATANLSTAGTHTIEAWAEYSGDMNVYNDTVRSTCQVIVGTLAPFPFSENFESFTNCSNASTCEATSCATANGWFQEPNLVVDDIDFRPQQGSTPTTNTGPDVDHTFGTAAGHYVYLEASACYAKVADLISPCISLAGVANPQLSFWYHLYGNSMGTLHVDVFANGEWTNDITTTIGGNQGNLWHQRQTSLLAWAGSVINLRFRGITGGGNNSDMAIDDILVDQPVGLEEVNATGISVYPNPAHSEFRLSLRNAGKYRVDVTSMDGQVARSLQVEGGHETVVDMNGCAKGIYTVIIRGQETVVRRITIL